MIWFSASWSLTILPNSLGLAALPLRMISVDGSNRLRSLPAVRGLFRSCGLRSAVPQRLPARLRRRLDPASEPDRHRQACVFAGPGRGRLRAQDPDGDASCGQGATNARACPGDELQFETLAP